MILNTPAPKLKSNTTTVPITELTLITDKSLLIVLTPRPRMFNDWWLDRKGLLSLKPDGVILWHSDHAIADDPWGRSMTDLYWGFKQLAIDGWDIFLSEDGSVWHELAFTACNYLRDSVIIPVYPSTFTLGDRN